jgi:hypothetical protein
MGSCGTAQCGAGGAMTEAEIIERFQSAEERAVRSLLSWNRWPEGGEAWYFYRLSTGSLVFEGI